MNNRRRDKVRSQVMPLLEKAMSIISAVLDEEQDCYDNYPENLQSSEKYEKIEEAIGNLEDAAEKLDEVKESLELSII